MTVIKKNIRDLVAKVDVFAVATASKKGAPNVAAIKYVKVLSDDRILMADIFMLKTRLNLSENPRMAIAFWYGMNGFQLKGNVEIVESGDMFDEVVEWVKSKSLGRNPKAALILRVDEIYLGTGGPEAGKRIA